MTQFAQGLGFDLTDTLTGNVELFAHFFQRVVGVHIDTETHTQYFGFAGGQAGQHRTGGFGEAFGGSGIERRLGMRVLDKIAQMRIFIVADRRFHGDRFFGNFQYFADFVFRHFHALSQFFRRRFTAHLLQHLTGDAVQFVDGFDHVYRNTDGTRLVGDGTGNGLTDPPGGVSRKLITTTVFEFIHRFHQADIAFLNQVEELQATVGVFLGNRNNQTQVRLDHFFLGAAGAGFTDGNATVYFFNFRNGQANAVFDGFDLFLRAENIQLVGIQLVGVRLAGGDQAFNPVVVNFVALETTDKVFTVHATFARHHDHNLAFLGADLLRGATGLADELLKIFRRQLDGGEQFGHAGAGFVGCRVRTAMRGQGSFHGIAGGADVFKATGKFGRIDAADFAVVAVVVIAAVIVVAFCSGGNGIRTGLRARLRVHIGRVDKTRENITDAVRIFFGFTECLQNGFYRTGVISQRRHHFTDAFFD